MHSTPRHKLQAVANNEGLLVLVFNSLPGGSINLSKKFSALLSAFFKRVKRFMQKNWIIPESQISSERK